MICTGKDNMLSTLVYIGMGWIAVFVSDVLIDNLPMNALLLFLAGGIAYTAGTLFYLWDKLPHNHGMWHVMVILGSICHYLAIYFYI
jgi:hemolysin III